MQRHLLTGLLLAALLGASACTDSATSKSTDNKLIQISSIHWDEVAAADSAAHVTNNGLIMMR